MKAHIRRSILAISLHRAVALQDICLCRSRDGKALRASDALLLEAMFVVLYVSFTLGIMFSLASTALVDSSVLSVIEIKH